MVEKNIDIVEAYYKAMAQKNGGAMGKYLSLNAQLISPFATISGKENILKAAEQFFSLLGGMTLRAKFGSGDQVMMVYNVHCHEPIGILRTAILLSLQNDLITSIELFHDTRMFKDTFAA